jgi:hypothetical protein
MGARMFRKGLAVVVILLFIGMCVVPPIGSIRQEDQTDIFNIETSPSGINITLDGTLGENGWYVSDVIITIIYDPEEIATVYYNIDGGMWMTYTEPIVISEDGHHTFCWYYVDNEGNQSDVECIDFKIDQTPPELLNLIIEKIDATNWLFTAEVHDMTSGINRVGFYVDERLVGIVTEEPYEWEWSGIGDGHVVQARVCDNAGNYGYIHPLNQFLQLVFLVSSAIQSLRMKILVFSP